MSLIEDYVISLAVVRTIQQSIFIKYHEDRIKYIEENHGDIIEEILNDNQV